MTIQESIRKFLEYCEITKNQSPKTIENYSHYLGRFLEFLGGGMKSQNSSNGATAETHAATNRVTPNSPPDKIDLPLVNDYRLFLNRLSEKGKTLSIKTQNYHIIALRAFLKFLTKNDIETLAPEKIELSKIPERAVEVLSKDELDRIFDTIDATTSSGARDLAILETLYSTGLRVSELANLNRTQVDLERREFMVRGKGKKPRIVFLSQKAADTIKRYLEKRTDNFDPFLIRARASSQSSSQSSSPQDILKSPRLSTVSIENIVSKYARKAGIIKKVTPHTLRHTYATQLLINGADIRSVQELLGHASITTTQIYTHVTNKALREIHEKFHK